MPYHTNAKIVTRSAIAIANGTNWDVDKKRLIVILDRAKRILNE
jgi:sugar lactone lactonase YvrE